MWLADLQGAQGNFDNYPNLKKGPPQDVGTSCQFSWIFGTGSIGWGDHLNGRPVEYWFSNEADNTEIVCFISSGFCLLQRQELRKIVGAAAQNEESSCPLTLHCTGDRSPADASLEILTSVLLPYATWGETSETSSCFSGHSHPSSGSYPTLPRKMLTPKIRNSPFCHCCCSLWPN